MLKRLNKAAADTLFNKYSLYISSKDVILKTDVKNLLGQDVVDKTEDFFKKENKEFHCDFIVTYSNGDYICFTREGFYIAVTFYNFNYMSERNENVGDIKERYKTPKFADFKVISCKNNNHTSKEQKRKAAGYR